MSFLTVLVAAMALGSAQANDNRPAMFQDPEVFAQGFQRVLFTDSIVFELVLTTLGSSPSIKEHCDGVENISVVRRFETNPPKTFLESTPANWEELWMVEYCGHRYRVNVYINFDPNKPEGEEYDIRTYMPFLQMG